MSHWTTFKQTATKLWVTLRHDILALAVFLNGLLIFKTIYGMSVNLLDIFHIKAFSELDLSLLANAPLFMLGVFLVLNSIGLLFRAKLAWAISIILLLIALIYTLHFYPWLKFSIGFCILSALIQLQDRIDGESRMSANNKMIFTMHCMIVSFYKFVESPADKRTKN